MKPITLAGTPSGSGEITSIRFLWLPLVVLATLLMLGTLGCGGSVVQEDTIATAQNDYDQAVAAFDEENYPQARILLDQALDNAAGLNPDIYVDALLKRSICLSMAEEFEAAAADINEAEQGATDMAEVFVARGVMFSKQGDDTKAKAEFANAKKLDSNIRIPKL